MRVAKVRPMRTRHLVGDGCPLTPRQLDYLRRLSSGETYKQIALAEGAPLPTVRSVFHAIYGKLGVTDRAQAVLLAERAGWLEVVVTGDDFYDKRTTPAQRLYLDAFDVLLLGDAGARRFRETGVAKCDPPHSARTRTEVSIADGRVAHHLQSLFIEARRPVPKGRPRHPSTRSAED